MINKGDLSVALITTLYPQKKEMHQPINFASHYFKTLQFFFLLAQTMESIIPIMAIQD